MRRKRLNPTSTWSKNLKDKLAPAMPPSTGADALEPYERLKFLFKESRWRVLSNDEHTELDALTKLLPKEIVHAIAHTAAAIQITVEPD